MNDDLRVHAAAGLTVQIDRDLCTGMASCVKVAPDLFVLDDERLCSFVADPAIDDAERILEACRVCPMKALSARDAAGRTLVP